MATSSLLLPRPRLTVSGLFALGGAVIGALLLYAILAALGLVGRGGADAAPGAPTDPPATEEASIIKFEEHKAKAAGVRLAPVEQGPLLETLTRPGRIVMNERKNAHLAPMVEGIIREVRVRVGQDVKAGDVLLVLDSKELGQAKLDLAKARLALAVAVAQHDWTEVVNTNTTELLRAMAKNVAIPEIDTQFAGRPIGEWRQQLVSAYSRRIRGKQNLDSVEKLDAQGAASAASLRAAQGEYDTAAAAFQAQREEIHFQNQQQLRAAAQKLREAQGQVGVTETYLLMVGYPKEEVAALDPIKEGARIGLYPLRAPFDGTILSVPSSLAERASPQAAVIQLGDLSNLWVQVELTEADLPAVRQLPERKITFRGPGLDETLSAPVFSIGDVVDKTTRTIALRAQADNADRRLKPGMFIEAQLRHGPATPVLHVPATAIQRHAGRTFVFVPHGEDEFGTVDVRVGRSTADRLEVVDGLHAGQLIVVTGAFALKTEMLRATLTAE